MIANNKFDTRKLETYDHEVLILPSLMPQTTKFEITDKFTFDKNRLLKDHILLKFKLYAYNSCEKRMLDVNTLLENIGKLKKYKNTVQVIMRRK